MKTNVKKDIVIGYPCYDSKAEVQAMQTNMQCMFSPNVPVASIQYLNGDSLVTRARNKVVHKFLQTEYDYLLFIDSDIIYTPQDIIKLRNNEKPICGGVYFKKKLPYSPVCNRSMEQHDHMHKMMETGTGFLMIHREVFESIMKAEPEHFYKNDSDEESGDYYDFFRVGVVDGRYLSEDYYFCHLARKHGYDIWLDTSIYVKHIGRATYPFDDYDLINGASHLLESYDTNEDLDPEVLHRLSESIAHQSNSRGWDQ